MPGDTRAGPPRPRDRLASNSPAAP